MLRIDSLEAVNHEADRVEHGQTKADRHGNAVPDLGNTQIVGQHQLDSAAAGEHEMVAILGADPGQHDQDEQLDDGHDGTDNAAHAGRHVLDQNIDAQCSCLR